MQRVTSLVALLVLVALSGDAGARTRPPRSIKLGVHFSGVMTATAVDASTFVLAAPGQGRAGPLGEVEAVLSWRVSRENVLRLLSGEADGLPLNTGVVELKVGDLSSTGSFHGTVERVNARRFQMEGEFTISFEAGRWAGYTATGKMRGRVDIRNQRYTGNVKGELSPPR